MTTWIRRWALSGGGFCPYARPISEACAQPKGVDLRGMTWLTFKDRTIVKRWDSWKLGRLRALLGDDIRLRDSRLT